MMFCTTKIRAFKISTTHKHTHTGEMCKSRAGMLIDMNRCNDLALIKNSGL